MLRNEWQGEKSLHKNASWKFRYSSVSDIKKRKKKRVYTFKCPECGEKFEINLARHLVLKHKYKLKRCQNEAVRDQGNVSLGIG